MGEVVSKRPVEREVFAAIAAGLDHVFGGAPLAPAAAVAHFLNMSTAKLARLGDTGRIRFERKGYSWRYYSRADVEAYLMRLMPPDAMLDEPVSAPEAAPPRHDVAPGCVLISLTEARVRLRG